MVTSHCLLGAEGEPLGEKDAGPSAAVRARLMSRWGGPGHAAAQDRAGHSHPQQWSRDGLRQGWQEGPGCLTCSRQAAATYRSPWQKGGGAGHTSGQQDTFGRGDCWGPRHLGLLAAERGGFRKGRWAPGRTPGEGPGPWPLLMAASSQSSWLAPRPVGMLGRPSALLREWGPAQVCTGEAFSCPVGQLAGERLPSSWQGPWRGARDVPVPSCSVVPGTCLWSREGATGVRPSWGWGSRGPSLSSVESVGLSCPTPIPSPWSTVHFRGWGPSRAQKARPRCCPAGPWVMGCGLGLLASLMTPVSLPELAEGVTSKAQAHVPGEMPPSPGLRPPRSVCACGTDGLCPPAPRPGHAPAGGWVTEGLCPVPPRQGPRGGVQGGSCSCRQSRSELLVSGACVLGVGAGELSLLLLLPPPGALGWTRRQGRAQAGLGVRLAGSVTGAQRPPV